MRDSLDKPSQVMNNYTAGIKIVTLLTAPVLYLQASRPGPLVICTKGQREPSGLIKTGQLKRLVLGNQHYLFRDPLLRTGSGREESRQAGRRQPERRKR